MEPATALVLYSYNSQMTGSCVQSVSSIMGTIFSLGLSAERIWQLMYSSDFEKETFGETVLPDVRGDLEIRDVSFAYTHSENRVPVLNHLSLKIPAGESVAFVGKSGCGKSTILSLLTRLYDPEEGQILLDGVTLSGGQRQRLALARSMLRNSPVVLLDEATSALDNETQGKNRLRPPLPDRGRAGGRGRHA